MLVFLLYFYGFFMYIQSAENFRQLKAGKLAAD